MGIELGGWRSEEKKTIPSARLGAPRHDCLEKEEEGGEAQLLPQLDLLREVPIDGGERRRLGQVSAMAPFRFRVSRQGKKEGERERAGRGRASYPPRREGARGCVGDEGESSVATAKIGRAS